MRSLSDSFGADFAAGLSGFLRGGIKSPHLVCIAPCCAFFTRCIARRHHSALTQRNSCASFVAFVAAVLLNAQFFALPRSRRFVDATWHYIYVFVDTTWHIYVAQFLRLLVSSVDTMLCAWRSTALLVPLSTLRCVQRSTALLVA